MNILVTGGAGFIGTHVVRKLRALGHKVEVLDWYDPQVHGDVTGVRISDIRKSYIESFLQDKEAVVHLAAQVGVGQSMYEIEHYVDHNCVGTAHLLEGIAKYKEQIHTLVVASSMSVYGEGWPSPIAEYAKPDPNSIYGVTKLNQEQMCLVFAKHYGLERGIALRLFNTYGEGQALSNPYTGAVAIFASRLMNGNRPLVYEDGKQIRDYIHVDDTSDAIVQAVTHSNSVYGAFNVGTRVATSVLHLAQMLCAKIDPSITPNVTGVYRAGDIRECWAETRAIEQEFGFKARVDLNTSLDRLIKWLQTQTAVDKVHKAHEELADRGLIT